MPSLFKDMFREFCEEHEIKDRESIFGLMARLNCYAVSAHAAYDYTAFPGKTYVPMGKSCLIDLMRDDYYISEKSKGERMLLYITPELLVYLVSLRLLFYEVELMHIPEETKGKASLFDGELVMDRRVVTLTRNGQETSVVESRLVYYITDALTVCDLSVVSEPFMSRLTKATGFMKMYENTRQKHQEANNNPQECEDSLPIVVKQHYPKEMARWLVNNLSRMPHSTTGIVFTPAHDPYLPGESRRLFFWQPIDKLTCRFILQTSICNFSLDTPSTTSGPIRISCVAEHWLFINDGYSRHIASPSSNLNRSICVGPVTFENITGTSTTSAILTNVSDMPSVATLEALPPNSIVECFFDRSWPTVYYLTRQRSLEGRLVDFAERRVVQGGWRVRKVCRVDTYAATKYVYDTLLQRIQQYVSAEDILRNVEGPALAAVFWLEQVRNNGYDGWTHGGVGGGAGHWRGLTGARSNVRRTRSGGGGESGVKEGEESRKCSEADEPAGKRAPALTNP